MSLAQRLDIQKRKDLLGLEELEARYFSYGTG